MTRNMVLRATLHDVNFVPQWNELDRSASRASKILRSMHAGVIITGGRRRARRLAYPKVGPESHNYLSRPLWLGRWLRVRLGSFPRFFFRGELLLHFEGHGVGIDTIDLSGDAEGLASIRLDPD